MLKKIFIYLNNSLISFFFFVLFTGEIFAENNPISPLPSIQTNITTTATFLPPDPNTEEWSVFWQALREKLIAKEFTLETWKKQIALYFEENILTMAHLQAWDTIIRQTPEFHSDLLMYATVFATQSILKEVQKQVPNLLSISLSSQFLLRSIDDLKDAQIVQLSEMMDSELKKTPVRLEQIWNVSIQQFLSAGSLPSTDTLAPIYESLIYLCMVLSTYLPSNKFINDIQLPEPMKGFFNEFNILIFDGGILTEAHYHSLRSIFSCFPPKLHNIRMIIIPEKVGVSATQLFVPLQYGIVTDLPFLPMEVMSNPIEFPVKYGTQIAPEFSMQVVTQIIRAIQYVQFRLRPELLLRRNALLMSAGTRNYNYTRPTIRPEVYFNNPDELLPLSSYLWMLNTEKVLQMAGDLLKIRQYFMTDVYLLLADLLSEGRDTTLTFFMDETGYITVREAPVVRAPIDEGYPAVITILPERLPPSFVVKEKSAEYGSGSVDLQNPSVLQGGNFSSGFNSPAPNNPDTSQEKRISIETKGN